MIPRPLVFPVQALLVCLVLGGAGCAARAPAPGAEPPADTAGIRERDAARDRTRAEEERVETERRREEARRREAARVEEERARAEAERLADEEAAARRALPAGAVLPAHRIVAFYGNPQSRRMGILGELEPDAMLAQLEREVAAWEAADPGTPVVPALHMIAVMAAGDPGADSTYRVRMPSRVIERVMEMAEGANALVFLDIQPGRSTVQAELPGLLRYLRHPHVHLALDPEWNMGPRGTPGERIGSMSAATINHAIDRLAALVDEHDLPPKVLVVHRFTRAMVRDVEAIKQDPRVQVVLHMDGWGPPHLKRSSYRSFVAPVESVHKGFKLFYRNDTRGGSRMMTPREVLELDPRPIYIQYQ